MTIFVVNLPAAPQGGILRLVCGLRSTAQKRGDGEHALLVLSSALSNAFANFMACQGLAACKMPLVLQRGYLL